MKKRNLNRRILFADEIIEPNKHTEEQDGRLEEAVEVEVEEYLGKSYSLPQDTVNENEESVSFGREVSSAFSDSSRLFERLENMSRNPEESNLLGVFGMDSDLVINEVISDLRNCRNCFYLGEININLSSVDIGDAILATVFRYIEDNLLHYVSDYSIRELYSQIEHNVNPTFDDEFDTPFERIEKLSLKSNRFSNIKNIFENLNSIMSHEYGTRERKFVIVIEMNENSFSYSNLKKISSLKSKNLIIIIKTMLSMEFANMLICNSCNLNPRETSIIYKFFTTSNIFCVY